MKNNCQALELSIKICIISFAFICFFFWLLAITNFNNKFIETLLNISIGVLGSGCVSLLLTIPAYNISKMETLTQFFNKVLEISNNIGCITYLYNEFNDETLISYVGELQNKQLYRKAFGNNYLYKNEKNKNKMINDFYQNNLGMLNDLSEEESKKVANLYVIQYTKEIRKKALSIYKQYINISEVNVQEIKDLLRNVEFFKVKKNLNEMINDVYAPLIDMLEIIRNESLHFKLYLEGAGNEAIALGKLLKLQNEVFKKEIKQYKENQFLEVNNIFFNKMQININKTRSKLFNYKEEEIKTYPVFVKYL